MFFLLMDNINLKYQSRADVLYNISLAVIEK